MTIKKDQDSKMVSSYRRVFMKASAITATSIGIGFVAASEPVLAAAIETDFIGIKAGEQMIPVGSFQLPAYVSRPEKAKGNLPIVIVVSEIFGVHEYIADVTRRFAKLLALAIRILTARLLRFRKILLPQLRTHKY
jgi:carboxymethylenebutenolidase